MKSSIRKHNNYNSENYKKYNSKNPFVHMVMDNFMKDVQSLINLKNINNILDVGCGEGFVINELRKDVNGIEISRDAALIAKSMNPDCSLFVGSAFNLPFKDNSYDMVMALEVLEHLETPENAIKEIKRVTKEYCIFSVPNEPYFRMMNMLRGRNVVRLGNNKEHVQNWSSRQFTNLVGKFFNIVEIKKPFPWTMVLCKK